MQAQVGGAVARALCCFREVPASRRDLRTLGFCGVGQGAAGCADLISGADRQRHTPANFPQAGEQFWRVLHRLSVRDLLFSPRYFAHHYFHPNTPSLATQDMPGLPRKGSVSPSNHVGRATHHRCHRLESGVKGKTPDLTCPPTNSHLKSSPPLSEALNNKRSVSMFKLPNSAPC